LSDPYGGNRDHAGQAVAIEDHLVLVASPYSHEFGVKDAGSVAVWTESGFNWSHDQKLTASHSTASAAFGASVALRSGAVLVGAPDEDLDPTLPGAGAAYRFAFDGTKYVESARFTAPTPAPGQQFGADVDLFEDLVVVGAPSDDTLGSDAGAAFTFRFGRKAWWFDLPLRASDAAPGDRFGAQVALGGTRIFASVDGHDDAGGADWGMVDAWFAGEVNLEITPASPAPGAAVTLDVFPGTPGDPLVAAIVDVASTPMFVPLFVTTFASDYEWSITGAAPNPAFGVRVGFRAFKISATGPIVFSEIAYVDL